MYNIDLKKNKNINDFENNVLEKKEFKINKDIAKSYKITTIKRNSHLWINNNNNNHNSTTTTTTTTTITKSKSKVSNQTFKSIPNIQEIENFKKQFDSTQFNPFTMVEAAFRFDYKCFNSFVENFDIILKKESNGGILNENLFYLHLLPMFQLRFQEFLFQFITIIKKEFENV
ncbi:hypothetical protein ACTFIV_002001 [Dictyostelium citrinum]